MATGHVRRSRGGSLPTPATTRTRIRGVLADQPGSALLLGAVVRIEELERENADLRTGAALTVEHVEFLEQQLEATRRVLADARRQVAYLEQRLEWQ